MRPVVLLFILVSPALAGCASTPDEPEQIGILAIDGRWGFPLDASIRVAQDSGFEVLGALVFAEAMTETRVVDVVGVDASAATALDIWMPPNATARALATVPQGPVTFASHAAPLPYVAGYFEMERTPPCSADVAAQLCFLEPEREGEARLRLRVGAGARDGGFLPDVVELSASARPAWWNGTFTSPQGISTPFQAIAYANGTLVPASFEGMMEPGDWTVRFLLETPQGAAAAGAAGIVRVREPGYFWFDDRIVSVPDARAQARFVLEGLEPTRLDSTVATALTTPVLGASVVLPLGDARILAGLGADEVSALLVSFTANEKATFDATRDTRSGWPMALRIRPFPDARPAPEGAALVFAAPSNLTLGELPRVVGVAPTLTLAGRTPVGEPAWLGDRAFGDVLLMFPADGAAPWSVPAGGKWPTPESALDNLSRARTLGLASPDAGVAPTAAERFVTGKGDSVRVAVAVGGVSGGPSSSFWTSASFIAGQGRPVAPRIIVPVDEGADVEGVREMLLSKWGTFGVVADLGG